MYVCTCMYVCVCVCIYTYKYMCITMFGCRKEATVRILLCMYVRMCVCVFVYIYIYISVYMSYNIWVPQGRNGSHFALPSVPDTKKNHFSLVYLYLLHKVPMQRTFQKLVRDKNEECIHANGFTKKKSKRLHEKSFPLGTFTLQNEECIHANGFTKKKSERLH
jgi:hypothetical protein